MTFIAATLYRILGRDRTWRLGRLLYMHARGEKSANAIALNGEADLVDRIITGRPDAGKLIIVDVGANLGEWTDHALQTAHEAGRKVEVHVFEPTPAAHMSLRERYAGLDNVHLHRIALSNASGSAPFAVVGSSAGTNSLELGSVEGTSETIEVTTQTGNDFAQNAGIARIDLLKIDTEGHDYSVLEGFEALFSAGAVGVAQFEYNSRWLAAGHSLQDVFHLARRTGYALGRVIPGGMELYDCWNPECDRFFEDNYALVQPELAEDVGAVQMAWMPSNTLSPSAKR